MRVRKGCVMITGCLVSPELPVHVVDPNKVKSILIFPKKFLYVTLVLVFICVLNRSKL